MLERVRFVDSHTGGEATRVIIAGGPDLGRGPLAERRTLLGHDFDWFGEAVIGEPRGSAALVGALLVEPVEPHCTAGVLFFNNAGMLNMCGHGLVGVVITLVHLGRIRQPGWYDFETPVGRVRAEYLGDHRVTIENVLSRRYRKDVRVAVPEYAEVTGDIAWGGNWFFLSADHGQQLHLDQVEHLGAYAWRIREALAAEGYCGEDGAEIDHIELFGPPSSGHADSRNFVLCPGGEYDRSPCGTGTSAKLACLFADGKIEEGQIWRQESIVGSIFEGSVRSVRGGVIPSITGAAYVTVEGTLLFDASDPFCLGLR